MTTLAFDTHQAVKTLTAAGADEAFVATIGDAVSGNVATKADLGEVKTELMGHIAEVKTELAEVEAELKGDIATVKADLAEVKAELKGDIAAVRAEIAGVRAELKTDLGDLQAGLYRHLWIMAAGIVGLTVSLTVALVRLTA